MGLPYRKKGNLHVSSVHGIKFSVMTFLILAKIDVKKEP